MQTRLSMPDTNRIITLEVNKLPPIHPQYHKLCAEWSYYMASYEGGARYKEANDADGGPVFIPHEHESDKGKNRRKRFSVYHNYVKAIVDRLVGYVHEAAITRSESTTFDEWEDNIDLCFRMREGSTKASVLGRWHWIVDSTKTQDIVTESQAQEAGVTITLSDLHPQRVIDWNKDFSEMLVMHENPAYPNGLLIHWKATTYIKYPLDKTGYVMPPEPEVTHGYPRIPIVTMWGLNQDCTPSASVVGDISEICRVLYNLDSILREELQRQTFSQWWVAGVDPDTLKAASTEIGSRKIVAINVPANQVSLTRMSSDPSQAESIRLTMEADVKEIYRMVGMRMPEVEVGPESGRALKVRFVETALLAAKISRNAEKAESCIIDLYNAATGQDIEHPEYPEVQDFDEASLLEDLKATLDMVSATLPEVVKCAKVQQYIKKDFARLDESERDELIKATIVFYKKAEEDAAKLKEQEQQEPNAEEKEPTPFGKKPPFGGKSV